MYEEKKTNKKYLIYCSSIQFPKVRCFSETPYCPNKKYVYQFINHCCILQMLIFMGLYFITDALCCIIPFGQLIYRVSFGSQNLTLGSKVSIVVALFIDSSHFEAVYILWIQFSYTAFGCFTSRLTFPSFFAFSHPNFVMLIFFELAFLPCDCNTLMSSLRS